LTRQPNNQKVLAIRIGPLTKPIATGPTFSVSIWGLEDFQVLTSRDRKKSYISYKTDDFYPDPPSARRRDTLMFACFLFPTSLAGEVDLRGDQPTLTRRFPVYHWDPRKIFRLKVIFLRDSPIFMGILPQVSEWRLGDRGKSGYQVDGPSEIVGQNTKGILEGIHLKASYPRPGFLKDTENVESLAKK
jgi:hypothetical protein